MMKRSIPLTLIAIFAVVRLAFAITFTDAFTGTNADLGTSWSVTSNACQRNGDQAAPTSTSTRCVEYYNGTAPGADQYAQFTLTQTINGVGSTDVNVLVRLDGGGAYSGYVCRASGQGNTTLIQRRDTGTGTDLATDASVTWSSGDTLRAEISGTTISCFRNGSLVLQTTDSTYSSGTSGVGLLHAVNTDGLVDNFESGDLSAPRRIVVIWQ